jgi:Amt family ammonium transporter
MAFSPGDTSYVIASTIGVLMMVLPGFVLYYAGMVHEGKVVKVVEVVLSIFCVVTLAWFAFGYSLSFGPVTSARADSTPIYGDGTRLWLRGLKRGSVHQNAPTVPEATYCSFQLAFAIVTSVLVIGSVADRVKLGSACLFTLLWHLVVYCPIAHAVWHKDGFLFQAGVLDFAGGNVVHISSGCSALVACAIVGNKYGFSKSRFFPSNMLSTFTGVCLLSIGWMGLDFGPTA